MEHAGKKNSKAKKPLLWIVLLIMAVIQIFPLVWLVDFSLASSNEMFTNGLLIIPEKIQWGNYVKAFVDGHFLLYLKNSVLINGLAVLLVILVSIMASFACRRMNWKLRIERACTYLEQDYLKTYEIAYRVGFRDEKYFSRVFKKVKGMSPKEYRTGNSQEPA